MKKKISIALKMLIILRLNIPDRHSGAAAVRLAARLRASPILRGRRRVPFADASSLAGERARSFARSSLEAIMLLVNDSVIPQ